MRESGILETFGQTNKTKWIAMPRTLTLIFIGVLICLLTTGVVFAREMIQGEQCTVESDEVITGTYFTFCQILTIDGQVDGNIMGIALRTIVSGDIRGNVYLAGLEFDLSGTVHGDLHYTGITLDINVPNTQSPARPIRGQLVFATLSSYLGNAVIMPGQVTGVGYQLMIDAKVYDEINYWGSALVINNAVNSDVYATVGNPESDASDLEPLLLPLDIQEELISPGLLVTTSGTVSGDLVYIGPALAEISGTVEGMVEYTAATPVILPNLPEEGSFNIFLNQFAREIMVLLTVGLIGLTLAPTAFQTPISNLRWRPVPSFVIGMLMFIVSFPIALILLLITMIISLVLLLLQLDGVLIVVASFLVLVDVGIIGGFYFTAIFVARAVFALGLGRFIVRTTIGHNGSHRMNLISLIIGVVVISMLAALPAVGFLFNASALFMGLGAITNVVLEWLQSIRDNTYQNVRSPRVENRAPLPPRFVPKADDTQLSELPAPSQYLLPPPSNSLGLKDLPEGFDPDFFFTDD